MNALIKNISAQKITFTSAITILNDQIITSFVMWLTFHMKCIFFNSVYRFALKLLLACFIARGIIGCPWLSDHLFLDFSARVLQFTEMYLPLRFSLNFFQHL